MFSDDVLHII